MSCTSKNLTSVPHDFPSLITEIILHSNSIKTVEDGAFNNNNLNHLERLDLSDNMISIIADKAFGNVSSLEWLMLHNNDLTGLNLTILDNMPNLKKLSLHNNPWECDCIFGPTFQTFIRKNNKMIHEPFSIYCIVTKEPILDINFHYCQKLKHSVVGLATMSAVLVFVAFIVILIYKLRLLLRVWAYNRFGAPCHKEYEENDDKPYDVFLAYALDDDGFVVNTLLQGLEEGPKSYAVRQLYFIFMNKIYDLKM